MVEIAEMKAVHSESGQDRYAGRSKPTLRNLAALVGMECEYVDGRGQVHQATDETLRTVLRALDIDIQEDRDIEREWVRIHEERWTQVIEPVLLYHIEIRNPLRFALALPLKDCALETVGLEGRLQDEQGKVRAFSVKGSSCLSLEETKIHGVPYVRIQVNVPGRIRLGYYQLALTIMLGPHVVEARSVVIAAPKRCYLPTASKREWGIGVQLYGVRSKENWGIGDFRDLERIMKTVGKDWGGATIGLPPLHSSTPGLRSPYSPSSRLCWNPLYVNIEQVAEFRTSPKLQRLFNTKKFQDRLRILRSSSLVEYGEVDRLKMSIFEDLYRVFTRQHLKPRTRRGRLFLQFVQQSPVSLRHFCTFQTLSEYFQGKTWRQWPEEYHDPLSPAVEIFQEAHVHRLHYFYYLQWLCELQLTRLDQVAEKAALRLGLYHDLPVGIHPDGADAWGFQNQLAKGATIGAPPDSFNLYGQNWGLLAPNPLALRQHGYDFFRQTISHNMKHGGVLRIDHALGLFRMFWVPFGKSGQEGLYVKTFVDEMLAVLALESVRHKVIVVGEDLGTVTPTIRTKLESAGLLSYRLLFFERERNGAFRLPHQYPRQALVSATTHDLPTLKGYWEGRDIEVKEQANLYPFFEDKVCDEEARIEDRRQLWNVICRMGGVAPGLVPLKLSSNMTQIIYQFLARTSSQLLMVQLEDALMELDTPNLPGAPDTSYPSWRLRLNRELTSWLKDPVVTGLFQRVVKERRRRVPTLA